MSDGPLIVQSDKTLLLDIDHILSDECRRAIAAFAELADAHLPSSWVAAGCRRQEIFQTRPSANPARIARGGPYRR